MDYYESEGKNNKNWVSCPYNPEHRMPQTRLQWHLVKCPDKKYYGEQYATCPYNATHKILKSDLTDHQRKCPDKDRVGSFVEEDEIDKKMRAYLASGAHKNSNPALNTQTSWEQEMKPIGPVGWEEAETKPKGKGRGRGSGRGAATPNNPTYAEPTYAEPTYAEPNFSGSDAWGNNNGWSSTPAESSQWDSPDNSVQNVAQARSPTKQPPQKSAGPSGTPKVGAGGAGRGRGKGGAGPKPQEPVVTTTPSYNSGYTSRHNEDFLVQTQPSSSDSEWQVVSKGKPNKPAQAQEIKPQQTEPNAPRTNVQSLPSEETEKRKKLLRKKIKEIEDLQRKQAAGQVLDSLQQSKVEKKKEFLRELASYK